MTKQFIAWPIGWELNYDSNRHSVRVFDSFFRKRMPLHNDICACVAETPDAAYQALIAEAKPYFENLKRVHCTLADGDFDFCFGVEEISSGKVFLCHNMCRREKI